MLQCSVSFVINGMVLMAYTGTPAARGSGVDSFRVTWAAVQLIEVFTESRCSVHLSHDETNLMR